jgi:hypothetical protein
VAVHNPNGIAQMLNGISRATLFLEEQERCRFLAKASDFLWLAVVSLAARVWDMNSPNIAIRVKNRYEIIERNPFNK